MNDPTIAPPTRHVWQGRKHDYADCALETIMSLPAHVGGATQ